MINSTKLLKFAGKIECTLNSQQISLLHKFCHPQLKIHLQKFIVADKKISFTERIKFYKQK